MVFFFFLPPGFFRQNSSLMWCFLSAESWVSNVPKASINRSIQTHPSAATLLHNDNTTLTSKGLSSPEKGDPFLLFFISAIFVTNLLCWSLTWNSVCFSRKVRVGCREAAAGSDQAISATLVSNIPPIPADYTPCIQTPWATNKSKVTRTWTLTSSPRLWTQLEMLEDESPSWIEFCRGGRVVCVSLWSDFLL